MGRLDVFSLESPYGEDEEDHDPGKEDTNEKSAGVPGWSWNQGREGAGICEEAFIEETGPIAVVRRDEYADIGLNKLMALYQSGTLIVVPCTNCVISIVVINNPTNTIGRIMLKRNHRKIAPPIAVDRLLKSVEKNNATLKNTNPSNMVAPMKIP